MTKILSANFHSYRNEAHYEYMKDYDGKLNEHPAVKALVQPFVPEFDDLFDRERKLVDVQKKNPYTAKIAEADDLNDQLVLGMKETVSAATRYQDPEVTEAAIRLNDRLKTFGKIESKSYEEEAAALDILLDDLQSPMYAADVATVKIDGWVSQLTASLANFKTLLNLRSDALAKTAPQENLRTVRKKIETVYRKMNTRINAAAELDEDDRYAPFIQQLNARIRYFNEHTHIRSRKNLAEGDHTVIKAIPEQQYTSDTITPIPDVYRHEEGKPPVKLTFTKDFTLTYKNNVKPGMAEVTIHGKGAYKGRKSTTFIIVVND